MGIRVFMVQMHGQDVGGLVLSSLGRTAVYLFGATNDLGREVKAGYFLQWMAMLYAKDQGLNWYDLAGVDKHANPGGYQFKSQMGGEFVHAAGPYEIWPGGWMPGALDKAIALRQMLLRHRRS
jgi:lipid II:glycine glycyltransferase (peptidoglycan interpeptide bridge formation enzyme)